MASNDSYSSDSCEEYFDVQEENSFVCTQVIDEDMTKGSDDITEMYCEECEKHDNAYIPAEGFCEDCVEYKCKTCIKFHRRHFGNHHIQDKVSMPQDFCFDKCTNHPKELIKFYCVKCEDFACCECRSAHQNCPNLKHLPNLVKDIEKSEELKSFKENLNKISKDIDIMKEQFHLKTQLAHTMETRATTMIKEHKHKLTSAYHQNQKENIAKFDKKMEEAIAKLRKERQELVDQFEEKLTNFKKRVTHSEQDVMKKVKEATLCLDLTEAKIRSLTNDVAGISNKIAQAQFLGQKCKLFVAMKNTKETLQKVRNYIDDLKRQGIQCYTIVPLHLKTSLEPMTAFFSVKRYDSLTRRNATFVKQIYTTTKNQFSFLYLISQNKLIEIDFHGECINTIENICSNSNNEIHNKTKMPSSPYGTAKVKENQVAVTFPFEGIVRLITFSESMTVVKIEDITVGAGCHGIAYCNDNLIVSYTTYPGKVQILDMAGNVLNCFEKDCNGQCLFSSPDYLALSPDKKTLYISDWMKGSVTSMTLEGKVKAIYKDDQLGGPHQLAVDEAGIVYVCGRWSNNVHQLSSDLTKVKILLDKSQEMVQPVSIAYCQNSSRLYVGMPESNKIKVFYLMTE